MYFHWALLLVVMLMVSQSVMLSYYMFKGFKFMWNWAVCAPKTCFKVRMWVKLRVGKETGEFCQWEKSKHVCSGVGDSAAWKKIFVRICLDTDSLSEPSLTFAHPEAIWCDTWRETVNSRGSRQRHPGKHSVSDITPLVETEWCPDGWVRQRTEAPKQLFHHTQNTIICVCSAPLKQTAITQTFPSSGRNIATRDNCC